MADNETKQAQQIISQAQHVADDMPNRVLRAMVGAAAREDAVLLAMTPDFSTNKMALEVSPAFRDYVSHRNRQRMIDSAIAALEELRQQSDLWE